MVACREDLLSLPSKLVDIMHLPKNAFFASAIIKILLPLERKNLDNLFSQNKVLKFH